MNLHDIKRVHMIGIKGTGMCALALVLHKLGIRVSGSDMKDSFLLLDKKNYTRAKIKIFSDFKAKNVPKNANLAIVTTSHDSSSNPEVKEVKRRGIKIITYPQMLGTLTNEFPSITVIGTHGKTSTTNLLSHVALDNKLPATALSGPTSQQVLNEMRFNPELFIFEADEYQNKLKYYNPEGVILTSLEMDHPDYFKTEAQYKKVFKDFVKRIPEDGFLVYYADDKNVREVAKLAKCKTFAYGISKYAKFKVTRTKPHSFGVKTKLGTVSFKTPLLGTHNMLNATAVAIVANALGLSNSQFQKSLSTFKGSPRRLEKVMNKPLVYDDYGHHPTEIKAALSALRSVYPNKEIWTVFQAHTFTRTKKFLKEFGKSFEDSDHTIVLDIWGSAREFRGAVHARDIVKKIEKNGGTAYYLPTRAKAAEFLKQTLDKTSLILTIGASDIWKIHKLLKP